MRLKAISIAIITIALFSMKIRAIEFGVFVAKSNQPVSFNIGFSGGLGLLIPFLKLEIEAVNQKDAGKHLLTGAIKFRPKLKKFAPYVTLGAGSEFERFHLRFREYDFFTFVGGGLHLYLIPNFSLRLDIRVLRFSEFNRTRIGIGAFIHL